MSEEQPACASGNCHKGQKQSGGNVQEKISCVFESIVVVEPSTKRSFQPYKVIAIDEIRHTALASDIFNAEGTEKLDGTCVYIDTYRDCPWLWARHDRKPSKITERKFKKHQSILRAWQAGGETGPKPVFVWDLEKDFKDVPSDWQPASGVQMSDLNIPLPDDGGHTFGWVPIDPRGREHLWHASTVDLDAGVALVLQPIIKNEGPTHTLEVTLVQLKDLIGSTMELIGTNVNANPYRLGSKKKPLHILVKHGSLPVEKLELTHASLIDWFQSPLGQVEGVVWYCPNGQMFKIHRHHLHQKWPVDCLTKLETTPVTVNLGDLEDYELEPDSPLFNIGKLNGRTFSAVKEFSYFWVSASTPANNEI